MRIVGFRAAGETSVGALDEAGGAVTRWCSVEEFWRAPSRWLAGGAEAGTVHPVAGVVLVPPVLSSARVICIGLNYVDHVAEGSYAAEGMPAYPTLFGRWTASLSVGDVEVTVPSGEEGLDWEGEVVAYVGAELTDVSPAEALAAVVGYSTFNDITARGAQKLTSQWTLGKNADRSGPLGPLVPAAEVGDLRDGLRIQTRVNGTVVQDASTKQMAYTVGDTLSLISRTLTLYPGDLLATGTPSGVGYSRTPPWLLHRGDVVEVEVDRLGVLRTPVG